MSIIYFFVIFQFSYILLYFFFFYTQNVNWLASLYSLRTFLVSTSTCTAAFLYFLFCYAFQIIPLFLFTSVFLLSLPPCLPASIPPLCCCVLRLPRFMGYKSSLWCTRLTHGDSNHNSNMQHAAKFSLAPGSRSRLSVSAGTPCVCVCVCVCVCSVY